MVTIKDQGILENIITHCEKIQLKISTLTKEQYDANEENCDLICFHILQIGELVKHLTKEFSLTFSEVPWHKIARMRDKVAHGYNSIDSDEVWLIANNDVPVLNQYCKQILALAESK